ncbi:MAG: cation transporter [Chthoniobacterales bacterium]|nr:cation transporter [Chthoniobacterales bacterium]
MRAGRFGILSAVLASVCCIGRLLLVAIGLGSGAAFFGRYYWLFLIGGLGLLTWAWAKYLQEKTVCDCEHTTIQSRRRGMFTLLVATVIVLGFAGLNVSQYVSASSPASTQKPAVADRLSRVVIPVEGMSCATCGIAVRRALSHVPGVKVASVSIASKTAEVDFDPKQTTTANLISAINATGYEASAPRN